MLGCCVNIASVPKAPCISCSRFFYFGHGCPKLNLVLISRLAGQRAPQNFNNLRYSGDVEIL